MSLRVYDVATSAARERGCSHLTVLRDGERVESSVCLLPSRFWWIRFVVSICQIATGVHIVTATHPIDPEPRRLGWESAEPITLGDNVWLGSASVVCPGVSVGDDTVVGAGAVVTKDLPAQCIAGGVPAKVIGVRPTAAPGGTAGPGRSHLLA